MHKRAQEFKRESENRYGFSPEIKEFDAGTKSAADAADVIGCDVAQIASSIVLIADGDPVVVIASGANHIDTARVGDVINAKNVRMAEPEEVKNATGWSIGGVPPLCHSNELPMLFDETLMEYNTVWAAAGTPQTVFPIQPSKLQEFTDATITSVAQDS
ncbi:MAG: YbaK/EbsC family protein [Halobacteriaceae archaeon]